jgi:hypothetical protein
MRPVVLGKHPDLEIFGASIARSGPLRLQNLRSALPVGLARMTPPLLEAELEMVKTIQDIIPQCGAVLESNMELLETNLENGANKMLGSGAGNKDFR